VIKVPVILATAILDYHNQEGLSRTFFTFLKLFSQAVSACFCLFRQPVQIITSYLACQELF
ncbi:hypothetical protein, partial [Blautia sp.]|uniref:hypothetical protein n=1 Tax=Blautia sp. TaxID=1955243 RepID=UPI002E799E42